MHRPANGRSGRPASVYEISAGGENLFPKRYDGLSIVLIDTVLALYGPQAVDAALGRVTDERVWAWEPRLRGLPLNERLELLKNYYLEGDPFISIERNGHVSLVERNCPFRNVAMARPSLCSVTVNTLTRLLGCRVTRGRTFQAGDGCCEFRIHADEPINPADVSFTIEKHTDSRSDSSST